MTSTTTMTITTAPEINRLHTLAQRKAAEAVAHALAAGKLLLEAKASIGHGGWIAWVQNNVTVTPRQAQRYMALAQGKQMPVRAIAKSDTLSHLPERLSEFVPAPGCLTYTRAADKYFLVEQSTSPEHYFVSAVSLIETDDAAFEGTTRPVRCDFVELVLQQLGLVRPSECAWTINRMTPVGAALEVCHG